MPPETCPTPVTIVTGFLGAGKTTLLRHLLATDHGRRIGVVVNDFGALDIDAELIREVHGETGTVRLTNGCICCSIRGDLLETVIQLTARPEPPEWIVVEASGISDPQAIAATFSLIELASLTRLDSVIAVLDADGHTSLPAVSRELAFSQIEAADLVLLNKTDLVSAETRAAARAAIETVAADARIVECVHCKVPVDILLGAEKSPEVEVLHTSHAGTPHAHADHATQYNAFTWESETAIDAEQLQAAIQYFPHSILRGKGFVRTLQAPGEAGEFHLVGRRASLTRGRPWRGTPRTRLVFIGEADAGAGDRVKSLLEEIRTKAK